MKYILLHIAVFTFSLSKNNTKAQSGRYFPDNCRGVYNWSDWDTKTVTRKSLLPALKGEKLKESEKPIFWQWTNEYASSDIQKFNTDIEDRKN